MDTYLPDGRWCAPEHVTRFRGGDFAIRSGINPITGLVPYYDDTELKITKGRLPVLDDQVLRSMIESCSGIHEVLDTGKIVPANEYDPSEACYLTDEDKKHDLVIPLHTDIKKVFFVPDADGKYVVLSYTEEEDWFLRVGDIRRIDRERQGSADDRPPLYSKQIKDDTAYRGTRTLFTRDDQIHGWGENGWGVVLEKDNELSIWLTKQEEQDPASRYDPEDFLREQGII